MPTSAQQSMATIDQFLQKVGSVKVAEDPLSEPGSIGGETSHPVKKVDDRLQTATEGARSSENSKDVKEDQGAPSVENAPEAKAASARNAANRLAKGQQKRAEGGAVRVRRDRVGVSGCGGCAGVQMPDARDQMSEDAFWHLASDLWNLRPSVLEDLAATYSPAS